MVLAFVVYVSLLLYMVGMAGLGIKMREKPSIFNITVWLAAIPFVLIMGLRYNVGIDYMSYLQHYENLINSRISIKFEPLYEFLNVFLAGYKVHFSVLFLITVFIETLFFYLIFVRKRYLLPFAVLFYFLTSKIFVDLNIIRHAIATMIFIYSVRFIQERKFVRYSLLLLLASGFHYSSLLLLPVYCLGSRKYWFIDKKWSIFSLFLVTLVLGGGIMNYLMDHFIAGFRLLGYSNYVYSVHEMQMEVGSGLGILLLHFLDFFVLLLGLWIKRQTHDKDFTVYYRIFFIGVLFTNIFGLNVVLSRFSFPLISVRFVVLAYIFYYLFYHWKSIGLNYKVSSFFVLSSYTLLFFTNIVSGGNQCSPFQFVPLIY